MFLVWTLTTEVQVASVRYPASVGGFKNNFSAVPTGRENYTFMIPDVRHDNFSFPLVYLKIYLKRPDGHRGTPADQVTAASQVPVALAAARQVPGGRIVVDPRGADLVPLLVQPARRAHGSILAADSPEER